MNAMRGLGLLLALTLAGCVSPVVIDHRNGTDFADFHTYALDPPAHDRQALSLDGQRVQQALRPALAGVGLTPAPAKDADLLVRYGFEPQSHFEGQALQFGFGFWNDGLGMGAMTPVEGTTVREDKLRVELVERTSHQVVWQATSRATLTPDMSGDSRTQRIHNMVRDMFERYPPKPGG